MINKFTSMNKVSDIKGGVGGFFWGGGVGEEREEHEWTLIQKASYVQVTKINYIYNKRLNSHLESQFA